MLKTYKTKEALGETAKKELKSYHPIIAQLLWNKNIINKEEAEKFLNPNFSENLHDPFLLPDMEKAVDRILRAINDNECIGIWSDYDADGIPGGALLHDFFKLIGYENFSNYIPDRHNEGYGLNKEGIDELKNRGVELLITIDCGVRDIEYVLHAKSLGIETIITDHHEQGEELPKAYAIVNPKIAKSKYPEKVLCGSGVVWKLIEAILKKQRVFKKNGEDFELKEGVERWLLDLVGLATLSDMVPLTGENRTLAHFGLSVIRKNRRPGLRQLARILKIEEKHINEDDIGFLITPRINAASRMGHPKDAFSLLVSKTDEEAKEYAKHLDLINKERKIIVAQIVKEAHKKVEEKIALFGERPVIVVGNPERRPSLLGLAANSIVEMYGRPAFLWGRGGGEEIKGSCRSDGECDLVSLMERTKHSFIEFGGHKFSGGFSITHENIHTLEEAIISASIESKINKTESLVDMEIELKDATREIFYEIKKLEKMVKEAK